MAEAILHVVPEDVEVEHVPQQVHPPAVEKGRRYGSEQFPDGKGPAAEEPGGDHRVPLEKRWEILPQGNLVEKKTEVGGDQQVVDDGEAVGWDRVADGNHRSSTPPACDLVELLCVTKRQVTEQEYDHLVATARYADRPPSANIREAVVHNAVRGKPKPSGESRHIHLRPLVKLGTHEPGTQGGGDNTRPSQSLRK